MEPDFVFFRFCFDTLLLEFSFAGCQLVMESLEGVLRKHVIKFHHNQNICETCGRVFNDPRLFDVHVKSAHSDVRDHFCDRCGKVH